MIARRRRSGRPVVAVAAAIGLAMAACAGPGGPVAPTVPTAVLLPRPPAPVPSGTPDSRPIRLTFIGDVVFGRDVADVVANDPASVFAQLGPALAEADVAFANLESPLAAPAQPAAGIALQSDPSPAGLLAGAGIDVVTLANDHATGPAAATVLGTMAATADAGLRSTGAGASAAEAGAPLVLEAGGLRVGVLAFDLSGAGTPATGTSPGVNAWREDVARAAVTGTRRAVDLLVVSLHGSIEDAGAPGSRLSDALDDVVAWGADIAWANGGRGPRPVAVVDGPRRAVAAPGLGQALADGGSTGPEEGTVLEVMADGSGVLAIRTGAIAIEAGRTAFTGWQDPEGDAIALRGEWWTPVRPIAAEPPGDCDSFDLGRVTSGLQPGSRVLATSCGAVSGPGAAEMVVAYRHPLEDKLLQELYPGHRWADADGMSAHLAVMTPDARMVWAAGTLPEPIGAVVACSGSLAVGHSTLDDPRLVAASVWTWRGFGFATATLLADPVSIGCADLDRDGATEPFFRRSSPPGGSPP